MTDLEDDDIDSDEGAESTGLLPLGEPPRDDVEAAARLFVRYSREAPLSSAGTSSFLMMVNDRAAVMKRATELLKEKP